MAFHIDKRDNSLVLDGTENGIADSPYAGIADIRNVNIISIPGEASVNFATSKISSPSTSGNVLSASAGADTVTLDATLESGQAISFAGGSLPSGISAGTVYWAVGSGGVYQLYTDYALTSLLNITSSGTGTFSTFNMAQPKYFAYASKESIPSYWLVDANGLVWSNTRLTPINTFWTYTGNRPNNNSHGNGLVYYVASDGTGYMFVFSDISIDYSPTINSGVAWVYQWNPAAGTTGAFSLTPSSVLKSTAGTNPSHETFVAPDSRVYYCDSNWIGRWYQTDPSVAFVPTTLATYTFDQTALLPTTDTAQCLTFLGTNILIGGKNNIIYPWDRFDTNFSFPILLPEYNVAKMVTVNTNTYIFIGNRGRIYYTNGSQVQLYKKVPDHISGTVEPYFTWGGATSVKNQLYFSALVTTNSGTAINQYGGVWGIDLDSKAIRLTNKLSYATYAGYATALIPNFASNAAGTGLFIGWNDNNGNFGLDTTISTPYTSSQATIDFDLIPIGTFNTPQNFGNVEYKLSRPLVSGESIVVKTRLIFNTTDTGYTQTLTDSSVGDFSTSNSSNIDNAQWVQMQAVLSSTLSNPSYVRLKEIRIKLK